MLGPVSSVASSARRRARRRSRLFVLVAVLLAFVIGELINEVVNDSAATSARSAKTWVAAIESEVADANSQSAVMDLVLTKGPSMGRPQLTDILSGLIVSADRERTSVSSLTLTPPSSDAPSALARVFGLRAQALGDLQRGVLDAISGGGASAAGPELAQAKAALTQAVAAYHQFLRHLKRADTAQLPKIIWSSPSTLWSAQALAAFDQQLSSATQLQARYAISITDVSLNPLPEIIPTTTTNAPLIPAPTPTTKHSTSSSHGTSTGSKRPTVTTTTTTTLAPISQIPTGAEPSVIAPTSTLTVIVVIANTGNVPATQIRVRAQLGAEQVVNGPIDSLRPGSSRYLRLPAFSVRTRSMATCTSTGLHRDRCATLQVSLTAAVGVSTHQRIPLAFFVG